MGRSRPEVSSEMGAHRLRGLLVQPRPKVVPEQIS